MGLDMYLSAKRYVAGWNHGTDEEKAEYAELKKRFGVTEKWECATPAGYYELTVAYWRKANQVHSWFVRNVQNGTDECQYSCISRTQLKGLLDVCRSVLAHPETASEVLPTKAGFFFGGVDYEECYWEDIKETISQLESVLNNPVFEHCAFYYHSSW